MSPFWENVTPVNRISGFPICYMESVEIRPETPGDCETIHRLTEAAFAPIRFSQADESILRQ